MNERMNKKTYIYFFFPAFLLSVLVLVTRANAQSKFVDRTQKKPQYAQLERILAYLILDRVTRTHFTRPVIDDTVSEKWFNDYFKALDPRKMYFYQKDLDYFARYKTKLDDLLKVRNLSFGQLVYKRFKQRVAQKYDLAKKFMVNEFDFDKDELYLYDREEANWFKDEKEAQKVWRKMLKNALLVRKIAKDEEKDKEKKTRFANRTPKQLVLQARKNYKDLVDNRDEYDVLEVYISSLTRLFDPHSRYWSWRTAEDFEINITLSLQGIGATLTTEDGYTKVTSLIQGGPAQKQGDLKVGDYIVEVIQEDGSMVNIVNMPLKKVVRYIRGKKGTKVQLIVETSGGAHKNIVIERDEVKLEDSAASGEVKEFDKKYGGKYRIGYIYLPSFYADWKGKKAGEVNYRSCSRDVKKLIEEFKKGGELDGLVIDLRGNGGGDLSEAINLSSLFIPKGPIVQVKYANGYVKVHEDRDAFYYKLPLLTLVDHSSASASEIFAGAIQDYSRGIVLGDYQTHGKGTVQTVHKLNERAPALRNFKLGSIKFTIAKFYRVTGVSTQRKGIVPNIIFKSFADYFESGEKDLDTALAWDEIKPAKFVAYSSPFVKAKKLLAQKLYKRLKDNKNYGERLRKIEQYGKIIKEKYVSLNEKKRRQQQDEREVWGKLVNEVVFGHIPLTESQQQEKEDKEDITDIGDVTDYTLSEAFVLMQDYFKLQEDGKQ